MSTVRWSGVSLAAVLERAGVDDGVREIVATGADAGRRDDAPAIVPFARSLPLETALHPDTLVALTMNDEPLTPDHGAPMRLVVPGWYGMASVKWLARIDAVREPFHGYFQKERYVYQDANTITPVDRMRVKSIIVGPADGATLSGPRVRVWGWAWSGDGTIERVEVSAGGGDAWQPATVEPASSPHEWSRWEATISPPQAGRHVLRSRATDAAGNTQPDEPRWNALGYGNNAVRTVAIDVA